MGPFRGFFRRTGEVKDLRSMRWHPVFIKWCLYLRHLSGRSYDLLGCLQSLDWTGLLDSL